MRYLLLFASNVSVLRVLLYSFQDWECYFKISKRTPLLQLRTQPFTSVICCQFTIFGHRTLVDPNSFRIMTLELCVVSDE